MKILLVMPLAEKRGGGEMMLWDLLQQGRDPSIHWIVIFLEDGPMVEQVRGLGIDARVVKSGRLREIHRLILTVFRIASIARRESVDVIVNWMSITHIYGGLAAMLTKLPSVWYQLEVPSDKPLVVRLATLISARAVVTLSKDGKEAQSKIWPYRPTLLVYPGVALDRFDPSILPSPADMRQKLGLPLNGPLIGIVGRLQRWKGMHVLVEAMPKILQKYPDAHCLIVGGKHSHEADYEGFLNEKIASMGLDERVIRTGLQSNVPDWVQAMDVFVHASDKEPFGIVIIEAMALGKPVIAGNAGGPTEIITEGVNGLLTPYGDADALANAILRYLDDQQFANNLAAAARQRALDFSTQRYAQNLINAVSSFVVPKVSQAKL
ncbi:glycosyltransferase family 4 protein [Aetokthonos hydrillicola Thurmond2011]|uniref:Glycosyltransferase family 4 protein n=1 Tax=Aetokthonos hydrillicola Thurmond2011 TaxID=2712845 RepID=A0AAP5ICM2_9CYAN|nr:glycosyltransferase family 4 protein [Aetokthonos hydrillicola]MBO3461305.1 glycosyltransferase family 4 protein [Aetokthonos hydrillicola CCALA 1050]MBW4589643.1 glycosyltransferase family 4 protein [Aetokthonos hydrillicola CCALA 1050]MDR9899140.1 glycosyltransferase family 4 protein [Aetokthonos hydrillicola Thurmond2011]